ncbi:MAG: GAF domain-containing protein [Chloroflexi bacterium]|nr:GAF domain-containing protein [Chloroflexota bacterium]
MNLTQQFLIISILPLSFIVMILYLWRTGIRRRELLVRWMITLILAAVWASSIMRFFGGTAFSFQLISTWGVIGTYAFTLMAIGVLITTFSQIDMPQANNRVALIISSLLWLIALGLEPRMWPYRIPDKIIAGQAITHFDIWAAVWIASWFIPLIAAIISAQRINIRIPNSLYRNQVQYWLLTLTLFLIGSTLNSIHQTGQPAWQQAGVIIAILASFVGTVSITQSYLPDLQLGARQFLSRLSGTLLIFVFSLLALSFLVRILVNLPGNSISDSSGNISLIVLPAEDASDEPVLSEYHLTGTANVGTALEIWVNGELEGSTAVSTNGRWGYDLNLPSGDYDIDVRIVTPGNRTRTAVSAQNLIILIAAALFAALFTAVFRFSNMISRRIFLPAMAQQDTVIADFTKASGHLPEPTQLARLFLRIVQSNLGTDDIWFFTTSDGPGGRLILRPLANLELTSAPQKGAVFSPESPIAAYFRQNNKPIAQYDIDTLDIFAQTSPTTKELLANWQRILYLPLCTGDTLVAILALGAKTSGESYDRQDFAQLQQLAKQASPLFTQSQNLTSLRQINDYVFHHNQRLSREKQHLQELAGLYTQFITLISPELRRPFIAINKQLHTLQKELKSANNQSTVTQLDNEFENLKLSIDNLITLSTRIQLRNEFDFQLIHMDNIAQSAIRKLKTMSDARRVTVEFNVQTALPAVLGDAGQLQEAIQHLLHNAIKFNKIGGIVQLDCGIEGSDLYLRVIDTGVGIPEERMASIWTGLNAPDENGNGRSGNRGVSMGLALTRFIVSAHGGRVDSQSKYGSGSVFAIYLPLVFEE